jgi:uncharacterized protein (TIGR03067 family)
MEGAMIRWHASVPALVGGLVVVTSLLGDPPQELPEAAKKELKALDGKWRVVKVVFSDREALHEEEDGLIFSFNGRAIDFAKSGSGVVVALDPETDPKCLDFKTLKEFGVLRAGSTYESVYKLNGDTLTWAVHVGREKNRPVSLDKPTDPGTLVIVLSRVKK